MNLNFDIKDVKVQIKELLGKLSKSPAAAGNEGHSVKSKKNSEAINKFIKPLFHMLGKYSYEHESIIGVDLTPHYVRVCQMKNSYDQWILNNLASACMETQFRKYDISANPDLYVENLKDLLTKNKITTKNAAFSLPTSSSIIKVLNIPDMNEDDFVQAAALGSIWESMVVLEGPISEYSVYYKILKHNPAKELPSVVAPINPAEAIAPMEALPVVTLDPPVIISDTPPELVAAQDAAPVSVAQGLEVIATETASQEVIVATPEISMEAAPLMEVAAVEAVTIDPIAMEIPAVEIVLQPTQIGPSMDVLFVATKLADINLHSDIIRRAGLNPVLSDIRCLSLKHAFESNPDNMKDVTEPYAFMEFGADENYIFVVDGYHTDIYNIFVSDDDKNAIIYSAEDKEKLQLFVQNYAMQAQQILIDHETKFNSGGIHKIFVTSAAPLHVNEASSAPLIKTFVEFMSAMMGNHKIAECDFCGHIIVPEKFAKQVNAEGNISSWAPTVGIASRKLDIFEYEKDTSSILINAVNLIPGYASYKKTLRAAVLGTLGTAAASVVLMLSLLASYVALASAGMALASEIASMDKIEAEYNEKLSQTQRLTLVMNQVKSLDDIKSSLPSNQTSIITAYRNITSVIPEGIWLNEVTYTGPTKIEILGNSSSDDSILDFVKNLNNTGGFEKLALKTMQTEEEKKDAKAIAASNAAAVKVFKMEGDIKKNAASSGLEILSNEVKHAN
jgi:Tfp pilus assembly PilM family ATPase/Tfp pilus assembly protein PilN